MNLERLKSFFSFLALFKDIKIILKYVWSTARIIIFIISIVKILLNYSKGRRSYGTSEDSSFCNYFIINIL